MEMHKSRLSNRIHHFTLLFVIIRRLLAPFISANTTAVSIMTTIPIFQNKPPNHEQGFINSGEPRRSLMESGDSTGQNHHEGGIPAGNYFTGTWNPMYELVDDDDNSTGNNYIAPTTIAPYTSYHQAPVYNTTNQYYGHNNDYEIPKHLYPLPSVLPPVIPQVQGLHHQEGIASFVGTSQNYGTQDVQSSSHAKYAE
jgi:hypothetical protein